jgi:mitogen-activated protein kinase kinase kinase
MEKVKQTCVKVFGEDGQTRIVNVHTANEAKQIMAKVLHKFGIDESSADRYCIFVGSSTNGEARALSDLELIEICRSADRPEKERLILRKRHMYPTHEEFKRKGTINAASRRFPPPPPPQDASPLYWQNSSTSSLQYHQRTNSLRSNHTTASLSSQQQQQQQSSANRRRFFGERPPSEIISSNLQSFFPNHNREVLETAGIKAQRLSMTRRNSSLSRLEPRNYRNSVLPELVSVLGVDLDKFLEEEEEQQQQRHEESYSDDDSSASGSSMSTELEPVEQELVVEEPEEIVVEKEVVSIVETKTEDTPLIKTEEPEPQPNKPLTIADHKKLQLQQKRSSSLNYLNEYKSLKLEEQSKQGIISMGFFFCINNS